MMASSSLRRSRFEARRVRVGFVVDEVALDKGFPNTSVFLCQYHSIVHLPITDTTGFQFLTASINSTKRLHWQNVTNSFYVYVFQSYVFLLCTAISLHYSHWLSLLIQDFTQYSIYVTLFYKCHVLSTDWNIDTSHEPLFVPNFHLTP